jgi:type IV pilus assembly protein PilC
MLTSRKITKVTITIFMRQLATLISAGVPICQSLDTLGSSTDNPLLAKTIHSINHQIRNGKNLSQALHTHVSLFDAFTIHLVKLGEHTGTLDSTLLILADHFEKRLQFSKKIRHMLFYPAMTIVTAICMTIIMFIFVIPRFAELFSDMHNQLPLITRVIFYLSHLICHHGLMVLITLVSLLILINILLNRHQNKGALEIIIKSLPLLNTGYHKITLAHFARRLGMCFKSGLTILDSLRLMTQPDQRPGFAYILYQLRSQINGGQLLHAAMQKQAFFPPLMIQMIKTGEETGKIDLMLDKIADFYESDIDHFIGKLTQLLEPLIMVILGVLIGGLVIGMYLPVFKLGSAL